jgi:hypothetical protein
MESIDLIRLELGRIQESQWRHGSQLERLLDQQHQILRRLDGIEVRRESASTPPTRSEPSLRDTALKLLPYAAIGAGMVHMLRGGNIETLLSVLLK